MSKVSQISVGVSDTHDGTVSKRPVLTHELDWLGRLRDVSLGLGSTGTNVFPGIPFEGELGDATLNLQ